MPNQPGTNGERNGLWGSVDEAGEQPTPQHLAQFKQAIAFALQHPAGG